MSALTRERVAGGLRRGRGKSVSNQKPPVRLGLVGAGYVVEHDLHRFSARAKEAELRFGSTEEWLAALGDLLRLAPDGA